MLNRNELIAHLSLLRRNQSGGVQI